MALKGHLVAGGLVGPLAGVESTTANDLGVFAADGTASAKSLSAYLDAVIGDTQGTILYRGASAWDDLAPADGYLKNTSGVLSWAAVNTSGLLTAGAPLVQNPLALSTTATQAHGLGVVPAYIDFALECLTTEFGWAVGEIVRGGISVFGYSIQADATNLKLITLPNMNVARKDTHVGDTITPASWKVTLTPYKLA